MQFIARQLQQLYENNGNGVFYAICAKWLYGRQSGQWMQVDDNRNEVYDIQLDFDFIKYL
jgi:hypothetical protein